MFKPEELDKINFTFQENYSEINFESFSNNIFNLPKFAEEVD